MRAWPINCTRTRSNTGPPVPKTPGHAVVSKLPKSLVGYWPLDGDGADLGPNKMQGSDPQGMWVAGKFHLALHFDGDDGMVIPERNWALSNIKAQVTM